MENTFSTEENERETKRLYALLDGGIRERLMKYPGVRHISVGLKITGGEMLWERCFHVYVDKKLGEGDLKKEDIVPPEIDGIKTDVHEIAGAAPAQTVCEDRNRHRPIKGGIRISNGMENATGGHFTGTLGVIGRLKGPCRCNTIALTNRHVLYTTLTPGQTIRTGSRIFQPHAVTNDNFSFDSVPDPNTTDSDIGKVINGVLNTTVDCALVEVNRSCCNCCGVPYENVINQLETVCPSNFNGVRGAARANPGDPVFFVGAKSGPSKAIVVTDSSLIMVSLSNYLITDPSITLDSSGTTSVTFTGQIQLRAADNTHPCNAVVTPPPPYAGPSYSQVVDHGDSGALLVNAQNMAVGLIFATDLLPSPLPSAPFALFAYANHYGDVVAALRTAGYDFEINYTQPPTAGSRGAALVGNEAEFDNEIFLEWKKRIEAHPKTRAIADAVTRHRDEVILLVNHCRPVTVAWHRAKGPAFAAVLADNVREEKFEFPEAINGVSAEQLLLRMRDVLLIHGSRDLKSDLEKFGDDILTAIKGKNNFADLLPVLSVESPAENNLELQKV